MLDHCTEVQVSFGFKKEVKEGVRQANSEFIVSVPTYFRCKVWLRSLRFEVWLR